MKRKGNLSEELYKMRKLMSYDSKEDRETVTSLDRLVEEKMVGKYLLSEQDNVSDPFANDSEEVKNHELYPLVTNWWKGHQKEDNVKKTLLIWSGGLEGSKEKGGGPAGHSAGIERLKSLQKKLTSSSYKETADTNVLANMVGIVTSWLENLANNGVYIKTDTTFGAGTQGKIVKLLLRLIYFGNGSGIYDANTFKTSIVNNIKSNLNLQSELSTDKIKNFALDKANVEKSSTGYSPFTDENKIEALNYYKQKAQHQVSQSGKYSKNINSVDEAIEKAITIRVMKSGDSEVIRGENIPGEVNTYSEVLTWPDINDPTPENFSNMETMFEDDMSQITQQTKSKIQEFIYTKIKSLVDDGYTIKEIGYGGYSSTSKVRTSFKGVETDNEGNTKIIYDLKPDGDKKYSSENNNQLAQSRVNSIESVLKSIIDTSVKNLITDGEDIEILKGDSIVLPNQGPEWVNVDNLGSNAKLYNAAKQKNNTLTPQKFYGNRSDNHAKQYGLSGDQLKQEYNSVYGPYRMNYGFVNIYAIIKGKEEETIPTYSGKGGYRYLINWKSRPSTSKKVKGNPGGGQSFVGVKLNTTACPKPNKGWWNNLSYEITGKK